MSAEVGARDGVTEMVVAGPWTKKDAAALASGAVDRLVLNAALGFAEPDLTFLAGAPIRELVLLDRTVSDLDPVHSLAPTLQSLRVTTSPDLPVDLGRLPLLRTLGSAWSQVQGSISAATNLEEMFLLGFRERDLSALSALKKLRELVLKDRPALSSLAGLAEMPALTRLGVFLARNLSDIQELVGRDRLTVVELQSCSSIEDLEALSSCTGLRRLNISECGDIASLRPIVGLHDLEQLSMFGSTKVVDGDLSPLVTLPLLRELRVQSRRSYRPTVAEVQALLTSR